MNRMNANEKGRKELEAWLKAIKENPADDDFLHTVESYKKGLAGELKDFGKKVAEELEPLVNENNLSSNLPRLESYDGIGYRIDEVIHHPTYEKAGNIIYGSKLLERMSKPGGLVEALSFMFLSSHAGEAGHNCPLACSAGIIRVLQKVDNIPHSEHYIQKLIEPSYSKNYTGAQFVTEIQGGSDVGLNATIAAQNNDGSWSIKGEKWFCSNCDAELILLTARFDSALEGTKGLGLFLIPRDIDGKKNAYTIRRLKDKIGTRSMASGEIDFNGAKAFAVGDPKDGFKLLMENVLHLSRLFNTACCIGMAKRAYTIALNYAKHRIAFNHPIFDYPLVNDNLAAIKAENSALTASLFNTASLQDKADSGAPSDEDKLLLRLLANLNKYLSALWSVNHIHHSLDVLAGNGAIESFSPIPRLLRDSIVCENWEGTHNTLRMQIQRDIDKYQIDNIFIRHLENRVDHPLLKKEIASIKDKLLELKNSPLLIKEVVDRMAILYAAECLYKTKKNDFDYFFQLHFEK